MQRQHQGGKGNQGQHDAGDENLFETVARFADDNRGNHQYQAEQGGGEINFPMYGFVQTQIDHDEGQGGKQGHHAAMQGEDAEIEAHQAAVGKHFAETGRLRLRVFVQFGHGGVGRPKRHHGHAGQGQQARHDKQAFHTDDAGQHRRKNQAGGEGDAYAQAYHRHRTGADFLTRQVGQQRGYRSTHRPRALQCAADDEHFQRIGRSGEKTAGGKQQQAEINGFLPAETVGSDAQRKLHQSLRQAVHAHGQADQGFVVVRAGQAVGIQCQHGQHQKHPQHPQCVHTRQRSASTPFFGSHLGLV